MKTNYYVLAAKGNLKTDDDKVRYYVEPSTGGGVEFVGNSLEEAQGWIELNDGIFDFVMG